jgi:hypothetical protein
MAVFMITEVVVGSAVAHNYSNYIYMGKHSTSRGLLIAMFIYTFQVVCIAQEFTAETSIETRLETVLVLNVDPEINIEFGLKQLNDNLYQVTSPPKDINFSVESTGNWNISITSVDPYFTGVKDPTQKIPVDFVGFYIENKGDNWDNGIFSDIANRSKDTILSLSDERKMVLTNGNQKNIGGADKNSFILRWEFIYENDAEKVKKFTDLNIKDEHFVGKFYITLSESKVSGNSINIPDYKPDDLPVQDEPKIISETTPSTIGLLDNKDEKKK